jgi:hypothetical protein
MSARSATALTALATALLALTLVVPPALAASGAQSTVIGPTEKVRPEGPVPSGATSARLFGARNEFVSFQVVVAGGPARDVRLALGNALTGAGGTIPAENVTIYREEYYKTTTASIGARTTGRWPDALIPSVDPLYHEKRTGFPIAHLPAGENRVFWVDVLVPMTQQKGAYEGDLVLSSDSLRGRRIPVHLDVRDFTLPSTTSLRSLFKIHAEDPCKATYPGCAGDSAAWSTRGWSTNRDYARLALDNRITIANAQFQVPKTAPDILNREGSIEDFETYQLPLINGTDTTTRLRGARETTFAAATVASSAAWRQRAEAGGFTDRSVFYNSDCDEPKSPLPPPPDEQRRTWPYCAKEVDTVHLKPNWPGLPNVVTGNIQDVDRQAFWDHTDIIAPVVDQMHGKFSTSPYYGNQRDTYDDFLRTPGKQLWMYTSCDATGCTDDPKDWDGWVDYTIDAAASQNRAMGWLAYQYDVSGELYYAVDEKLDTAWTDQWFAGGNGDGTLYYPWNKGLVGGETPIPIESMRMKLIRNGHQDYEYLRLAGLNGHEREAHAIARRLYPSTFDTITTDAEVDAARRELADLAEGVTGRVTPMGPLSITPSASTAGSQVAASFRSPTTVGTR